MMVKRNICSRKYKFSNKIIKIHEFRVYPSNSELPSPSHHKILIILHEKKHS